MFFSLRYKVLELVINTVDFKTSLKSMLRRGFVMILTWKRVGVGRYEDAYPAQHMTRGEMQVYRLNDLERYVITPMILASSVTGINGILGSLETKNPCSLPGINL